VKRRPEDRHRRSGDFVFEAEIRQRRAFRASLLDQPEVDHVSTSMEQARALHAGAPVPPTVLAQRAAVDAVNAFIT
jgi:hypothetical protein